MGKCSFNVTIIIFLAEIIIFRNASFLHGNGQKSRIKAQKNR